jgi:hypothetical protein
MLRRFWFTFKLTIRDLYPPGVLMGCGVTSLDEEDAIRILREKVFVSHPFPAIKSVAADIDLTTLDQGHVIPNMTDPSVRGVWFPIGYK